jgi:hypothetical protein
MCFAARRAPAYSLPCLTLLIFAAVALEGCGQNPSRQDEYSKNNPKSASLETVGKFSGHVTVDGATQLGADHLFIFLVDPQHPDQKLKYKYSSLCKPDGSFEFTTYFPGDGVPLGKYVVATTLDTPGIFIQSPFNYVYRLMILASHGPVHSSPGWAPR